jgi:serine/threonine-protein kinase
MSGERPSRIGKYDIRGKIGQGAMGEVFKGHDPVLGRDVAIKTMAGGHTDSTLLQRFQREAQSAARLNHANIITVYDFGEEQGRLYMAMELLEGTDLKDAMGTLSFDEKLRLMEQIADGLAFAHAKHVIHRDLKPANIHIQPNGQVKIMDFGLARLGASEMTATGTVMGTPNHMSPEQVRGEKADARSDIFSIGSVFYELLTDRKPFAAESMHAVLFQVLHSEPEPVRKWAPALPAILAELVEKCMAKDAAKRFRDGGHLREALAVVRRAMAEGRADSARLADEMTDDAQATLVDTPKVARSARGPGSSTRLLAGVTALKEKPAAQDEDEPTVVASAPTLLSPSPDAAGRPSPRASLVAGVGAAAVALAVGGYLMRKPGPPASAPALVSAPTPGPSPVPTLEPTNADAQRTRDAARTAEAAELPAKRDVRLRTRPTPAPPPAVIPATAAPPPAATLPSTAPSTTPTPSVAAVTPAPPPPTAPPATPPPSEEPAIRRVIAEFAQAIERKDLVLYKSVRPNLSAEDERKLRAAFDSGQSQQVSISIGSIQVSGAEARVRVTRRDTFKGRGMEPLQQTWVLVKGPGGWTIREIGS